MNSLLSFALLLLVGTTLANSSETVDLDIVQNNNTVLQIHLRMNRSPNGKRHCGKRIKEYVDSVCEKGCEPGSNIDLATECCSRTCEVEYIKKACCPDKL